VIYQINRQIVTKEEWDAVHIEWREREHMENQGDNEEYFHRENPPNNEDQENDENTISTLVFPISDIPTRGENISTWGQMRKIFLNKCQDYCQTRERREELFKISQKEEENLEDFCGATPI
jgi:hypothetical protein